MATPLYCRKCGTHLPTDSPFCPACGASQAGTDDAPTHLPQQEASVIGTGRLPAGRMLHQRYRLLHTVGQGGMGAVYVAQDTQLGDRLVAVKEMSMSRLTPQDLPQAVEQFRREAHLLASLHHPNLPVIHEYFRESDRWYLVMSFIEGQNLRAALDATPGKRFPVNEVVRLGIELCEVLDYLHTHDPQVIFRDLKPLNIMLTPKGHICLIDFGIARHFKQEQTKDTAYYYSVGYAPPEQYGQSQTGPRSDIYSLGATLHQMLSGHNPASKPFQFSHLQVVDPTIPVPLTKLITQMLEMSEQARPASIAEVKAELENILRPRQVERTEKAGTEKNRTESANFAQHQASASYREQISQSFWEKINTFFGKRRVAAWVCFIVLSLATGSLIPLVERLSSGRFLDRIISTGTGDLIAGIGAAGIGLLFLLPKDRPSLKSVGSFILTVLGNCALYMTFSSYPDVSSNNLCYISYGGYCNLSYFLIPFFLNILASIIWLLVGAYLFLQKAKTAQALAFGIFHTLIGIVFLLGSLGGADPAWNLGWGLFFLPPTIVGSVALIFTLRKRQQSKRDIQS